MAVGVDGGGARWEVVHEGIGEGRETVCIFWFLESGHHPELVVVGICSEGVPVGALACVEVGVSSLLRLASRDMAFPVVAGTSVEHGG